MQTFTTAIPLSLYIHLPWCVRKCPYCDFNSHTAPALIPEDAYIDALIADFEAQLPAIWGRRLVSIFFGGGTPSLFSGKSIERLLLALNSRCPFQNDIEITLEANPGTLDETRFQDYRQAGVNRLSLGIQSLQDEKLKALGRIHLRDHALRAVEMTKRVGFTNFNLDLMHGLPNQTVEDALADLRDAMACEPTHLSWYQLTLEPNTLFHQQPPTLPPEDTLADIQDAGKDLLAAKGYQQYEISAYSQPGRYCEHNLNYWEFGDYIGIGAGAHSKITDMEKQQIHRHWQVKNPRDYLDPAKAFTAETRIITAADSLFEFMMNALRLTDGVSLACFTERTGLSFATLEPHVQHAQQKGFLAMDADRLRVTALGQRFLNDVVSLFLPEKIS